MISRHQLHITAPFRYLWLKSVTGVDLSVHCAKCLLGEYDERISNTITELRDLALAPAPYTTSAAFHGRTGGATISTLPSRRSRVLFWM